MKKPIRVRILDHEYLIKGDEDEVQVERIARFVNEKFKEVRESTEGLSERKTAILVAFDIASDYLQIMKERDSLLEEVQHRAKMLNDQIDLVTRENDDGKAVKISS